MIGSGKKKRTETRGMRESEYGIGKYSGLRILEVGRQTHRRPYRLSRGKDVEGKREEY